MQTKFLLLVGDNQKQMFDMTLAEERLEVGVNFEQSPSVAMLIEQHSSLAQRTVDDARSKGIKVGTYANLDKGVEWLHKVLNLVP